MKYTVAGFGSRVVPSHVLAGLRALNPAADLVYLGAGRWLLCLYSPSSERRATAYNMLERLEEAVRNGNARSPEAARQRARFALLMYNGYQAIDAYDVQGSPDSSIVHDYAQALWMLKHKSEQEQLRDAIESAERTEAADSTRKELMDEGRHKDAWRYAFTRSHAVTRNDDPHKQAQQVKAGRVRHTLKKEAA